MELVSYKFWEIIEGLEQSRKWKFSLISKRDRCDAKISWIEDQINPKMVEKMFKRKKIRIFKPNHLPTIKNQ